MKKRIHINQHLIRANKKHNERNAVITAKTYKDNWKGNRLVIYDVEGNAVATVIYNPNHPLPCGAQVWIETKSRVSVDGKTIN